MSATPFVLVHGAWHGGWCWSRVVPLVWSRGGRAYAPTLTGLGERVHLFSEKITLDTHIEDVVNLILYEDLHDVVLCGHSYGGCVIAGAIERVPDRIASAVFLDAFIPADGESVYDILPEAQVQRWRDAIEAHGDNRMPPVSAASFHVDDADQASVDALCVPHPAATFTQKLRLTGALERVPKRSFVRAANYPSVTFDRFRAQALAAGWTVYDLPSGHDAMLALPERLTEILFTEAG